MSDSSKSDQPWPVVKVTMQPEIYAALDAVRGPDESIQAALSKILAKHFGIDPVIRVRGNPSGKAKPEKGTP